MSDEDGHSAVPTVLIGSGARLDVGKVVRVARAVSPQSERTAPVELTEESRRRIGRSAEWVENIVEELGRESPGGEAKAYYGINTGFGALAGKTALQSEHLTKVLSRNLLMSHAAGVGEYLDEETVRAAILLRAHSLAQGHSGVRERLVTKLIDMLNAGVYPAVPCKGSLGASGDLAPLSHLALVLSAPVEGDGGAIDHKSSGEAWMKTGSEAGGGDFHKTVEHRWSGRQKLLVRVSGHEAMKCAGGQIELRAKEALALNNGTNFSGAIAALTLNDALNLLANAELALSLSLQAIHGFEDPFFDELHEVRGHAGARESARLVRGYIEGSQLLCSSRTEDPKRTPPQDPYSFRCAPQVHGTIRDTLGFIKGLVETELNASTDNPLIFPELERGYKMVSGGNFHGEPLALAMDFLGIAVTELGSISERRTFLMTDYQKAGQEEIWLPPFLTHPDSQTPDRLGLNSGLMIPQYTAASLVSDCKTLAHPDSVDSITSSAHQEDHVSMSMNASRHSREIVDNVEAILAIEILCACQALEWRLRKNPELELGRGTRGALGRLRQDVGYLERDRVLYPDIRRAIALVRRGSLIEAAQESTGGGLGADPTEPRR